MPQVMEAESRHACPLLGCCKGCFDAFKGLPLIQKHVVCVQSPYLANSAKVARTAGVNGT